MPGLHSAFSRHLFTLSGNVLKSGGAKNLAKGQFAIVKSDEPTANGAKVISVLQDYLVQQYLKCV